MSRRLRYFVILLTIAVVAAAAGFWTATRLRTPPTAAPASVGPEDPALPDLDGYSRRLSEWRGHVVLLNFWATWCPPCRDEIPLLKQAQSRYGKDGLQVIGVAIDEEEAVATYHREVKMNYPVLLGELDGFALMVTYGNPTGGLPYSVILDRAGQIVSRKIGPYQREELETALAAALSTAIPLKK